jgi:tetratricopeptide (TPR) repeat protein
MTETDPPLIKGRRLLEAGDLPGAKAEFQKALELDPSNAENYNSLGLVALREGRLQPDAEGLFRQAVERDGNDPAYTFNLGLTYIRLNRPDDAGAQFQQSLKQNPDYMPAHWGLAAIYFNRNQLKEAKAEYEFIRTKVPNEPDANNQLGRIALAERNYPAAEAFFRVAIEAKPDDWILYGNLGLALKNQNRNQEAVAAFRDAIKRKTGEPELSLLQNIGECLFADRRLDEAKEQFEQLLARQPANDQVVNSLGRIALATGKFDEAERYFRRAGELDAGEPAYATNVALARMRKGDSAEAERLLTKVITDFPKYYPAQVDLGSFYFEQGSFEKAKVQFESALKEAGESGPSRDSIENWLGRVALALGRPAEAEAHFRAAAALNAREPVFLTNLGLSLGKQGKPTEAEAAYRRALEIEPGNSLAHIGLGSIFFERSEFAAATQEFKSAQAGTGRNPEPLVWLGRVARAQAELETDDDSKNAFFDEAEAAYRQAIELNGESYLAHRELGSVYLERKKFDNAREEFSKALKGNPNDAEGHQSMARVAEAENDYRFAEREYLRSIELDTAQKLPSARLYLGALYSTQERFQEARDRLEEVVRIDPNIVDAYYELGRLFFRQRKFLKALEHQMKANGLNPGQLREGREIALTLVELERYEDAERRLRSLIAPSRLRAIKGRSRECRIVYQTLASLYLRWGKAVGDHLYFDSGLEALDQATDTTTENDRDTRGQILCLRGIINCHRRQYPAAQKDFERSIACFEAASLEGGVGGDLDPTCYIARRNLARLKESFAFVGGVDPIWLKRLSFSLAIVSAIQLILLWILFLGHWAGVSPKMFATLNPVFFGMILLSLLLPQLSKFKLGGITAEVAKPEQIQGAKVDFEEFQQANYGAPTQTEKQGANVEAKPLGSALKKAQGAGAGQVGGETDGAAHLQPA